MLKSTDTQIMVSVCADFLSCGFVTTHCKLLWHINPDSSLATSIFDFALHIGMENIIAMVISISYSVITVIIINGVYLPFSRIWTFALICWFGIIDGLGIWLYYRELPEFRFWAAIYYGAYTFSIICALGLNKSFNDIKTELIEKEENIDIPSELVKKLRQEKYKRTRNLKYAGKKVESDKIILKLNTEISKLLNK